MRRIKGSVRTEFRIAALRTVLAHMLARHPPPHSAARCAYLELVDEVAGREHERVARPSPAALRRAVRHVVPHRYVFLLVRWQQPGLACFALVLVQAGQRIELLLHVLLLLQLFYMVLDRSALFDLGACRRGRMSGCLTVFCHELRQLPASSRLHLLCRATPAARPRPLQAQLGDDH